MAKLIQQSTANDPLFFFLVLSSDHVSPATGLSPTVTLSKNGAAFGSPSGAVTEIANGWYQVAGNATDTGTLGDLLLHASVATADNCDLVAAQIVAFNPRNANLGLSNVTANVAQINGVSTSSVTTVRANVGTTNPITSDSSGNVAIQANIKKNTASAGFMFVMTDATTGAPSPGLTVTGQVSIDGAAFTGTTNAPAGVSNGWYKIDLAAADTNGNHLALRFTAATASDTNIELVTLP